MSSDSIRDLKSTIDTSLQHSKLVLAMPCVQDSNSMMPKAGRSKRKRRLSAVRICRNHTNVSLTQCMHELGISACLLSGVAVKVDGFIIVFCAMSPGDSDVEELKSNLAAPSMPEQLFGSSFLRLIHHSGCVLDFNAADALCQWHQADEPPVQVPCSATCWQQCDRVL